MKLETFLRPVLPEFPDTLPAAELELLKELPNETLYFALKEADAEQSLWVFEKAREEQIQGVIDLDCWRGEEFQGSRFSEVFKIISFCEPKRLYELSKWLDPELFVRGLIEYAVIGDWDIENPLDIPEKELLLSPDSKYYLHFKKAPPDFRESVYQWMNKLAAVDIELLRRHLESCKWEQRDDLEEFAYQIKKGRLEDMGFVEREEAIALYAKTLAAAELKQHCLQNPLPPNAKVNAKVAEQHVDTSLLPDIIQRPLGLGGFLKSAVDKIEDKNLQDTLVQELSRSLNAHIVADDLLQSDSDTIRDASLRARLYIDLGLAYLADANPHRAVELIRVHKIFDFHRLGWLLIQDLVKAAGVIRENFPDNFFGTTDSQLLEELEGRHPQLSSASLQSLEIEVESFIFLEGVTKVGERLGQISLLGKYLQESMGASLKIKELPLAKEESVYARLLNGVFRQSSGSEWSPIPLALDEWVQLADKFDLEQFKKLCHLIAERCPEQAREHFHQRLDEEASIIEEFVKAHGSTAPDPKFFKALSFRV